jgi:hypothetical protein
MKAGDQVKHTGSSWAVQLGAYGQAIQIVPSGVGVVVGSPVVDQNGETWIFAVFSTGLHACRADGFRVQAP